MSIEKILDGLHASVVNRWWTQLFTAFVRVLLGLAFIPPSIKKIRNIPFTVLPDSNPVGAYFNALYHTGFYYEFIGWSQLLAAVLLLIPRTSHLGALLFLPIIVNIAVLTNSVGFVGTWLLTILMSLAALHLVCWEYDRLKPVIFRDRSGSPFRFKYWFIAIPLFFAAGGVVVSGIFALLRIGNFPNYLLTGLVLVGLGLGFGVAVAIHYRFMSVGKLASEDRIE